MAMGSIFCVFVVLMGQGSYDVMCFNCVMGQGSATSDVVFHISARAVMKRG